MSLPSAPPADTADGLVYYLVDTPEGSVGVLDGFERDALRRPAALIVAQGWFGRRRLRIPIEQLAEVDHLRKRIILAAGAAPIEHKGPLMRLIDRGESPCPDDDAGEAFDEFGWTTRKRRPVLCEIGGEEHLSTAVSVAAELARDLGAPLTLVTPLRPPPDDAAPPSWAVNPQDEEPETAARTIDVLLSHVAAGIKISHIVAPESHTLSDIAADMNACFIVVASHGQGSLGEVSKSGSGDFLHDAPCPVVVPAADRTTSNSGGNPFGAPPTRTDDQTLCPACGRITQTIPRGACADCWQRKLPDGEAVFRPMKVRPSPLLESVGGMPAWVVIAVVAAIVAGLLAGLAVTL